MSHGAVNHRYVLDAGLELAACRDPVILDYGCGAGGVVALGKSRGLDIVGTDTYAGPYASYLETLPPDRAGSIVPMAGAIPFPDAHFDLVIANQVFEHVGNLKPVLGDIARVLRPGGVLLGLFPVTETWYEGHVGLYFAHHLQHHPKVLRRYLSLSHRLGLGLDRIPGQSADEWADASATTLRDACVYRTSGEARALITAAIGSPVVDLSAPYLAYRLRQSRFAMLAAPGRLPSWALAAITNIRAGEVLAARKPRKKTD